MLNQNIDLVPTEAIRCLQVWEGEVAIEEPSESPGHQLRRGVEELGHWCSIASTMRVMNRKGETGSR